MELNQLIQQLLESGVIENQELGVTLLSSPEVSEEDKRRYIEAFIDSYGSGDVNWFSEEQRHLFEKWVELYTDVYFPTMKNTNLNNKIKGFTWINKRI